VKKVASKTFYVKLQSLPPTSAAAKYHSLGVYFQVQEWKESAVELYPKNWGMGRGICANLNIVTSCS